VKEKLNEIYYKDIQITNPNETLYIIGNGFDLMHKVPSRYIDFYNTIGKRNNLKFILDNFFTKKDIWGNFEDSLAYLNREIMMDSIDVFLPNFDIEDEDFTQAEFEYSKESCLNPIYMLTQVLPRRFREWVNSLSTNYTKKPFNNLININCKFINFNYTEFLETLYNINKQNITYIHGDRRNKKDILILGHGHDCDELFNEWHESLKGKEKFKPYVYKKGKKYRNSNPTYLAYYLEDNSKGNWRTAARYYAIQDLRDAIEDYYEESAKKTNDTLKKHEKTFLSYSNIKNIIIIGHSLSKVDYPYYEKIIELNNNKINFYISFFNKNDISNILEFKNYFNIKNCQIKIFDTKKVDI